MENKIQDVLFSLEQKLEKLEENIPNFSIPVNSIYLLAIVNELNYYLMAKNTDEEDDDFLLIKKDLEEKGEEIIYDIAKFALELSGYIELSPEGMRELIHEYYKNLASIELEE